MSNVATVSFKIAPDRYAILKALATSQGLTVSQFLRQTVEDALDLEQQVERLVDFFGGREAAGLPPVEWVWPSWLPRGMLSLLGAAPGAGKSLVALDLARRVIHCEAFPDSARRADAGTFPGGNVVYVDAEAVPSYPSLRAAIP